MMFTTTKMVSICADKLFAACALSYFDKNGKNPKLLTKKPYLCQIHADLREAKFMPNKAKSRPNLCQMNAILL